MQNTILDGDVGWEVRGVRCWVLGAKDIHPNPQPPFNKKKQP
jgi:hypothetical protein